jgi:hypothetical protein
MKKLFVLPTIALLTSISTAFAQTDDNRQRIATGPPTQLVSAPPASRPQSWPSGCTKCQSWRTRTQSRFSDYPTRVSRTKFHRRSLIK